MIKLSYRYKRWQCIVQVKGVTEGDTVFYTVTEYKNSRATVDSINYLTYKKYIVHQLCYVQIRKCYNLIIYQNVLANGRCFKLNVFQLSSTESMWSILCIFKSALMAHFEFLILKATQVQKYSIKTVKLIHKIWVFSSDHIWFFFLTCSISSLNNNLTINNK